MNRLHYMHKFLVMFCTCFAIIACTDDVAVQEGDGSTKATANLVFSTRANPGEIDENEGIKTLRIIVTEEDGTLLYNQQKTGLGDVERHAVSIELPKTKVRFYAIANEESMGHSFTTEQLEQDGILTDGKLLPESLVNKAWEDDQRIYFPKQTSEISEHGLPMTGCKGVQQHDVYLDDGNLVDLTNKTVEQIEIPLVRCVVKFVVKIKNAKADGGNLEISTVNFGRFFTDKVYYYMHSKRTLPENSNITHQNITLNPAVSIPINEQSIVCTLYTYPVSLTNSGDYYRYSIALNNNNDYKVFLTKDGEGGATYIPRNSRLAIEGTVTEKLNITWTDLQLVVSCWEDKDMNITFE